MKKILIFRQSSLGDFLAGIPALKIVRKKFFNYKIYNLSYRHTTVGAVNPDSILPILNDNKLIDEFIYIDQKDRTFVGLIKLIIKLRKYKFIKLFYLNDTEVVSKFQMLKHLLFFSLCKTKKICGFDLQYKANYAEGNESFHLARRVDSNVKRKDIERYLNNSYTINKYSQNLTLKKILPNKYLKKFITISYGLRNYKKDWGQKNWKILLKKIIHYYPSLTIIIIGTKIEYQRAKNLKKIKSANIINLCGKTNIKELIEIINKSKFHISHDDGTMHVASLFSKKSIAIFSNIDKEGRWSPPSRNSKIFYPKISIKKINPNSVLKKFRENFKKTNK